MRGVGLRRGSLDSLRRTLGGVWAALEMTRDGGLVGGDVYLPAGEGEGGFETRPYDGEIRWPPLIAHG